ncbi:substrate-binding domain-containing protein [Arthrobacter sp. 2RAF6]|uniref:substrate-binding domain-containing protein n=1 Tax=Arthrobacter sp. 2RAF6 TaxID=3233002 RepID=UPI003F8E894A
MAGRRVGSELVRRRPPEVPDGLFCTNDLRAIGAMQSILQDSKLRLPEDIAIIGYDDIDFAQSAVVPLSSIRQPARPIDRQDTSPSSGFLRQRERLTGSPPRPEGYRWR